MKQISILLLLLFLTLCAGFVCKQAPLQTIQVVSPQEETEDRSVNTVAKLGTLAFFSAKELGQGNLYIMDEEGGNVKRIGRSGSRPDHYPNWSPDGQYLTFSSYRKSGWRIWIMKADGTEARRILNGRLGISTYEFDPSFSADGSRIFFASNGDLYSVKRDGTGFHQITNTPNIFEYSPYQSPDSNKLLFVSRGQIYVMTLATGEKNNLTQNKDIIEYAPIWAPDGKQILYYSNLSGSFELYLMDADGSDKKFVLNEKEMKEMGFTQVAFVDAWDNDWGAIKQYKASFSADGQKIAFSRDLNGSREIFVVNRDGTGIQQLTNNQFHDGFPMWKPN